MNEKTRAGPAPRRMTSPWGPTWPAAAVPIAPKMPAPITAPMASMMRSPAPSVRFSCPSTCWLSSRSAMGFRRKTCKHGARILLETRCQFGEREPVGGVAAADDHLVRAKRDADQARSGDDQFRSAARRHQ